MNWRLSKIHLYILVGVCVAILLIFAGLFYLQVYPMKTTIETKKEELQTQQTVLDSMSAKLDHSAGMTYQSTMELQKKLPVKPLGDQLILDFEKAEVISSSLILKMEVKDEEVAEDEGIESAQTMVPAEEADSAGSSGIETASATRSEFNSEEEQNEPPLPLPQGVKKLTVKVTVQADDYAEIEKFIETMESSRRIIKVDSIDFSGTEEVTSIEQNTEPLVYTVSISAFYSPDLIDLQKHIPNMEAPLPADKINPLSIAPDVYQESKQDNE